MSEYSVELKGLNKVYSNLLKEDTIALKDINLQIRPGEFISIIGPSGCGKSTLLRIIGNLDKPTSGMIEYRDGADQQMGFVFQDSVLLPWKNVRQNAEFPLVIQKKQTKENEEKLNGICSDRGNINLNFKKFIKENGHTLINSYNGALRNNHAVDFADIIGGVCNKRS